MGLRLYNASQLLHELVSVITRVPKIVDSVALLLIDVEEGKARVVEVALQAARNNIFGSSSLVEERLDKRFWDVLLLQNSFKTTHGHDLISA